jgi:hypothetical protein
MSGEFTCFMVCLKIFENFDRMLNVRMGEVCLNYARDLDPKKWTLS